MLNVFQCNEYIGRVYRFVFILSRVMVSVDCHLMPIMIFLKNRVKYRICVRGLAYNRMQQNAINLSLVDKYAVALSIARDQEDPLIK